jgi:hypothetical protein
MGIANQCTQKLEEFINLHVIFMFLIIQSVQTKAWMMILSPSAV